MCLDLKLISIEWGVKLYTSHENMALACHITIQPDNTACARQLELCHWAPFQNPEMCCYNCWLWLSKQVDVLRPAYLLITSNCNDTFHDFEIGLSDTIPTEPHFKILNVLLQLLVMKWHGMDTDGLNTDVPRNLHRRCGWHNVVTRTFCRSFVFVRTSLHAWCI